MNKWMLLFLLMIPICSNGMQAKKYVRESLPFEAWIESAPARMCALKPHTGPAEVDWHMLGQTYGAVLTQDIKVACEAQNTIGFEVFLIDMQQMQTDPDENDWVQFTEKYGPVLTAEHQAISWYVYIIILDSPDRDAMIDWIVSASQYSDSQV